MDSEFIIIGEILTPRGKRGEVKVSVYSRATHRLEELEEVYLQPPSGGKRLKKSIEGLGYKKGHPFIKLSGINSIEEAEKVRNYLIEVLLEQSVKLKENEFFQHDLLGASVFDRDNCNYGVITEIFETSSNDILLAEKGKKEYLIPFIKSVIYSFDEASKVLVISPLPGLFSDDED